MRLFYSVCFTYMSRCLQFCIFVLYLIFQHSPVFTSQLLLVALSIFLFPFFRFTMSQLRFYHLSHTHPLFLSLCRLFHRCTLYSEFACYCYCYCRLVVLYQVNQHAVVLMPACLHCTLVQCLLNAKKRKFTNPYERLNN